MPRANFNITINGVNVYYNTFDGTTPTLVQPCVSRKSVETTVGVSRRKPTGRFIDPTPYSYYHKKTDYATGSAGYNPYVGFAGYGKRWTGVVGPEPGVPNGAFQGESHFGQALSEIGIESDEGLGNAALIAVRTKLKSSSVNLGVAFGERKQTAMLLGSTATRLASAVRHLRRGEIRRSMDELGISSRRRQPRGNNVPRKWLELQYGWKPLLSDVYGAASALEQRPKGDWRVTASVTRKIEGRKTAGVAPGQFTVGWTCEARWLKSVYTRIDALPQNEATISLASLGVLNPLSVAWELVPFSFVVDWCLPIGGWLDSLDALLGYGPTAYSSSLLVKASWKEKGLSGSGTDSGGYKWISVNSFGATKRLVSLQRSVSSSVPLPSLPSFKDPRSLGHMANGLALLASAFGRR